MGWKCPFCGQIATITMADVSIGNHHFKSRVGNGQKAPDVDCLLVTRITRCPNRQCNQFTAEATLGKGEHYLEAAWKTWTLFPESLAQTLPDYVPKAIREDYAEACLIESKSPKASATLCRRALQGMIRDFHGIRNGTLNQQINALKGG
jgi:hypothetical protein